MIEGNRERRKAMREREIENLLLRLGANRSYTGFYYVISAVQLSIEDENKLQLISKWLYPEVAKKYHTSEQCVERNIRTLVALIWNKGNRSLLEYIAYTPLNKKPNNAAFISILVSYLCNEN